MRYQLAGVRALVMAEQFRTSDYVVILEAVAPGIRDAAVAPLSLAELPALEFVIQLGTPRLPALLGFDELARTDASPFRAEPPAAPRR